jgi:hypothetical protein
LKKFPKSNFTSIQQRKTGGDIVTQMDIQAKRGIVEMPLKFNIQKILSM